jgi:iron complex transport system substrate-binding protein
VTHNWTSRLVTLLAAGMLLSAACSSGAKSNSKVPPAFSDNPTTISGISTVAPYPVAVARSDGKPLSIAQAPARIVSLSPGATEIIYAIGAEASLAAVDKNADYPAAAKSFSTKVDAFEPNIESIAALKPDLVIVASDTGGIVAKLDELKIPVFYVDIDKSVKTINDIFGQISLLGRVTGKTGEANTLVASLGDRRKKVELAVRDVLSSGAPNVYHELDETFYSASDATFVGDIYHILHMQNIAGDGGGVAYPQLTQEAILAANPRLIVLADEGFGVTVDSVKARPGWSAIDAVKNGQILGIDPSIVSRPGPRIIDALEAIAKGGYPDRFK